MENSFETKERKHLMGYTFVGMLMVLLTLAPTVSAEDFNQPMPGIVLLGMGGGMGGGGMMGSGRGMTDLWNTLSRMWGEKGVNNHQANNANKSELRSRIRERREELRTMVRSENPERAAIDQKIRELDRLESELYDR